MSVAVGEERILLFTYDLGGERVSCPKRLDHCDIVSKGVELVGIKIEHFRKQGGTCFFPSLASMKLCNFPPLPLGSFHGQLMSMKRGTCISLKLVQLITKRP